MGETITGDIVLIPIVIVLIVTLSVAVLSKWPLRESNGTLALYGTVLVILALASGYGIAAYVAVPITVLSQILPFILLGIGIDGVFILVASLEETDVQEPHLADDLPERIRRMMERGAASITVASLTDVFAFLFGSATTLPAVQWFCW